MKKGHCLKFAIIRDAGDAQGCAIRCSASAWKAGNEVASNIELAATGCEPNRAMTICAVGSM